MDRTHQHPFLKNKTALAGLIPDGRDVSQKCEVDPEDVAKVYNEGFGGESQSVDLSAYYPAEKPADNKLEMYHHATDCHRMQPKF
jgi:hypothetical protein